jgi:hypothetical protein
LDPTDADDLDGKACQPGFTMEGCIHRAGRCGRGDALGHGLADPAGSSAEPGTIHSADPLAQGKAREQPSAKTKGGPPEDLGSTQLIISSHANSSY